MRVVIEKPARFLFFVLAVGLAILLLVGLLILLGLDTSIRLDGEFEIKEGSSAQDVWQALDEKGFTDMTWPWQYYAWRKGASSKLKPGTYILKKGESMEGVIGKFVAGNVRELVVTYPEGFTLKQMASRTARGGIGSEQDFRQAARPENFSGQFTWLDAIPKERNLEGYLFPDTYRVFVDDAAKDVVRRLLANFDEKFSEDLRREATASGRTLDEIVIMASIVEREVTSDKDMAIVAGVLWKRVDEGAGIDADATIRYALNKWEGALTAQDLANESPYNTRKWRGLPPGPISNPGLRAIIAAVRPEPSEYYYYLSAPDGTTIFSKTLAEHNINKAKYLK